MTAQQLAERVGCSYMMALRLMKSSGFPAIQIGRRMYCDVQAFEAWYEEHIGCVVWRKAKFKPIKEKKRYGKQEFISLKEALQ